MAVVEVTHGVHMILCISAYDPGGVVPAAACWPSDRT